MKKTTLFRKLIEDEEILVQPGVYDGFSARLVEQMGFKSGSISGAGLSESTLGWADVGLLSYEANVSRSRDIAACVDIPLSADADTGYGSTSSVARTVELWEQAGAAGMFLEDQEWPKKCGHMDGKQVVDRDEWLTKLRTALRTRSGLHVTARTDARAVVSLDEAITRGKIARDLGVDAVFVEAPQSVAEMETIAAALPDTVLVANMVEKGKTPLLTPAELADLGFRLIVSPLSGLLSAAKALADAYATLRREGTMRDHLGDLTSFDEFTAIVGLPKHLANEQLDR